VGSVSAGICVRHLPPTSLAAELERLDRPWIADEGALDATLERGPVARPLRERGLAFDGTTTLRWDESGVQALTEAAPQAGVVALSSPVLVRPALQPGGLGRLRRIDYLERGVLLGSRYLGLEEDDDA
jgi:hypothetical protein